MNAAVLAALISGAASIFVTIITVLATSSKTRQEIQTTLAVQDERIRNLSEEVRRHNDFGSKIPSLETEVANLSRRLEALERR